MTLLDIDNLSLEYRSPDGGIFSAVRQVSLAVAAGETLGIVGESGCGKSTLARAALGYLRPGSRRAGGTVRLDGEDLFTIPPGRLRALRGGSVALVPQQPLAALTPHIRVGDQVAEIIRTHRQVSRQDAYAEVEEQFRRTRLPDPKALMRRFPHEISGGQRQRVAIAAALAGAPKLLVLDEPTTALDKTTETEVLALLRELQDELGTALVYVSHDLHVIRAMCSRILVMRAGEIVEAGATEDLFNEPRSAYARSLVAATLSVAPRPRRAKTEPDRKPILELDDVSFNYGRKGLFSRPNGKPALAGVSLAIAPGESFGVVGESGSGKSTLAALVSGLLAGSEGTMNFDGAPLAELARRRSRELRRRIQLVFQDPLSSLNPAHSIEAIICRPMQQFFGRSGQEARHAAIKLMQDLELDPALMSRRPGELSGGQQQRVALARAFASEPDLVICDEVTSALDVTIQAQVVAVLKRFMAERNTTFVFISHDLGFINEMADRVLVLEGGIACETGRTGDILRDPGHPYTRRLLDAYRGQIKEQPVAETPVVSTPSLALSKT